MDKPVLSSKHAMAQPDTYETILGSVGQRSEENWPTSGNCERRLQQVFFLYNGLPRHDTSFCVILW